MDNNQYLEMYMVQARKKYTFTRLRLQQISELLKRDDLSQEQKLALISEITNQLDVLMPASSADMDSADGYDIESLGNEIPEIAESNVPVSLGIDQQLNSNNKIIL